MTYDHSHFVWTPIHRFANPNVVRPYFILLRSYSQNSAHTNHCIIRMLHRLAVDLKMEALFYQLSVFCVFNKILEDPAAEVYQVRQHTLHWSTNRCHWIPFDIWLNIFVILFLAGAGYFCKVCSQALFHICCEKQQSVCGNAFLEECGCCERDDRRL